MKKLVFFIAALFTTYFAQAQEGIKLGLKAGANLSSFTGKDVDNAKNLFGFHMGGFVDYGISEMVSIRPELLYSTKGVYYDESEGGVSYEATLRTHYIDVPVLARINAGGLFFELGPTFSYLLTAKLDDEMTFMGDTEKSSETVTKEFNKFDVGYAAGLGYQLESGLGFGLRYNGGLSKLDKDGESKSYNSVFQLSLSYTLGL